jgi:hypothetical protein
MSMTKGISVLSVVKRVGTEFVAGTSYILDVLLWLHLPLARTSGSKEK